MVLRSCPAVVPGVIGNNSAIVFEGSCKGETSVSSTSSSTPASKCQFVIAIIPSPVNFLPISSFFTTLPCIKLNTVFLYFSGTNRFILRLISEV